MKSWLRQSILACTLGAVSGITLVTVVGLQFLVLTKLAYLMAKAHSKIKK